MFIEPEDTKKIIKFQLPKGFVLTGRELSAKLIISKNIDNNGNKITLIIVYVEDCYCFKPIADIYYDYNKTELIMPKLQPIFIHPELYRDIIPSMKYKGLFVFSPDSDFKIIFKEVITPKGRKMWMVAFDTITLYSYTEFDNHRPWDYCDEGHQTYLSYRQLKIREKEDDRLEAERQLAWDYEVQSMKDELFEEAGYDFMD